VELVRCLIVDPKEARRVRYRAAGEKLPRGIQRARSR
jgi:putative ubiquitin-RnfH superfamily antitoxin RatB of RatAB toxin-antitoxin module